MKLKILGLIAGGALLALQSTTASARTDVWVDLNVGIPTPVVVERRPVYHSEHYYEPAPVYYHRYEPRYEVRHYERARWHDNGRHRGHHKHKHRHHH